MTFHYLSFHTILNLITNKYHNKIVHTLTEVWKPGIFNTLRGGEGVNVNERERSNLFGAGKADFSIKKSFHSTAERDKLKKFL